jgi:hypothetical protein
MAGVWRAIVGSEAHTDPGSPDPRLRGRTYAIPFDRVWTAAVEIADGGMRGWRLVRSDDVSGVLEAEAIRFLPRRVNHVRVRVGLDENGQTRVDAQLAEGGDSFALGGNRRRLLRFMRTLDKRLGATSAQILDTALQRSSTDIARL